MTRTLKACVDQWEQWGRWYCKVAVPEAVRVTSSAEPDALTPVVMSGGAEPAGAAKLPLEAQ